MPRPADMWLRLAKRGLVQRAKRGLAEVRGGQLRDPGLAEGVDHLKRQHRRVAREQTAALLDPGAADLGREARVRRQLLVVALGGGLAVLHALTLGEAAVDLL